MKKILLALTAFVLSQGITNAASNQSPFAIELSKQLASHSTKQDNLLNGNTTISVILKITPQFDFIIAKSLGITFPTFSNGIATARVPLDKYLKLTEMSGVEFIEIGGFASPTMDSARSVAHIQEVIDGIDLPQSYKGEGVVVGVIDAGFDYTHPAFYDSQKKDIIISRVWDQGKTGTPPTDFNYGQEFIGSENILNAAKDIENFSHGSHVAGIAVGQPVENVLQYQGIATKSELVIVALHPPVQEQWKNTSGSDIIDGVNYIFKYAASVGKPAVVNLSWGGQIGPHDGTSLFSQAIDGLVGEGKIFVCSAGNDGEAKLHIDKQFSATDTMLTTYIANNYNKDLPQNGVWLDVWGEEGKSFDFSFDVVNQVTLESKFSTGLIPATTDSTVNFIFKEGADSCNINVYTGISPYNHKPHAFANLEGNKQFRMRMKVKAKEGKVNAWNWYLLDYYGIERPFSAMGKDSTSIGGNTSITISDFASTKRAIAVGAMVSKASYVNYAGNTLSIGGSYGDLAPFSSWGPTVDGRVKPDITSPGMGLVSAVNSYDSGYIVGGTSTGPVISRITHNDKPYSYAIFSGTSMSSPATSGAIALLLSAKPKLTPEDAIALLKGNATIDTETGSVPNAKWGNGKLNLHKAMKWMLGIGSVNEQIQSTVSLYPNPFTNALNVKDVELANCEIRIYNQLGSQVFTQSISNNDSEIQNLSHLAQGIYLVTITKDGKIIRQSSVVKI